LAGATKTPQAEEDLLEIWVYIARDNEAAANRLYDRIERACATLAEHPHIGLERPELIQGVFSFPIGNYVIYYRPIEEGIEVVRVLHGARDARARF
jgi:toxin ParE1/3/4